MIVEDSLIVENLKLLQADRAGNLYAGFQNGDIAKFVQGKETGRLSTPINAEMASIEPGTGLKIFIYYEELQQYLLADRNFTQFELFRLPASLVNYASTATLSEDQNVWLTDPIDFSIKKISILNNEVLIKVSNEAFDFENWENILDIKEYGSYLFIGELNRGIHLFDNFGNFIKFISFPNLKTFDVQNENIFVITDSAIHSYNFYKNQDTENDLNGINTRIVSFTAGKDFLYFYSEERIFKVKFP